MSSGMIISKDGASVDTRNPKDLAVDSTFLGAMKVAQRVWVRNITSDWDGFVSIFGTKYGTKTIPHNLGYAPAFILYHYVGSIDQLSSTPAETSPATSILMPTLASSGVSPMLFTHAESDKDVITIYGIPEEPERSFGISVQREGAMLLIILAEDLDAEA